jgi:hypothetical protein
MTIRALFTTVAILAAGCATPTTHREMSDSGYRVLCYGERGEDVLCVQYKKSGGALTALDDFVSDWSAGVKGVADVRSGSAVMVYVKE